jgi:hypothetical protein
MSTSSSTLIQTRFGATRRPTRLTAVDARHDHGPQRSGAPARVVRIVGLLRSEDGHWAMVSASGQRRGRAA